MYFRGTTYKSQCFKEVYKCMLKRIHCVVLDRMRPEGRVLDSPELNNKDSLPMFIVNIISVKLSSLTPDGKGVITVTS